jgi:hypothetical protein
MYCTSSSSYTPYSAAAAPFGKSFYSTQVFTALRLQTHASFPFIQSFFTDFRFTSGVLHERQPLSLPLTNHGGYKTTHTNFLHICSFLSFYSLS